MLNFDLTVTQQISILALQLGVIIFAAKFCGDLAKKIKMPSVLGELAAGILIGPYILGGIGIPCHGLENGLFAIAETVKVTGSSILGSAEIQNVMFQSYHSSLYAIATIGSILLLFMSGLETDLNMFFRYSVVGTVVGLGGVIFSFLFGDLVSVFLLGKTFMDPCSLFLGILCTATSVGITARILSERKKMDTPEGVTILAAAVIDDVLGIICLAIVMGIVSAPSGAGTDWARIGIISLKCVGFWLIATAIGLLLARYIAKFLKWFKSPVIFANLAFGLALILSGIFEQQGLSMIIGAYVMGLSLSKTDVSFAIQRSLEPLSAFFVPVFFVIMGMLVDVRVFADAEVLKIGLLYSLLAILAKIIGCALPSLFMNFNLIGSLRIGTGMVPRGEVALIIASIGMATMHNGKPILDSSLFGVAIIMTLATTVLAPPLLALTLGIGGKGVKKEVKDMTVVHTEFRFPSPVVTELILRTLMDGLKKEGYMLSHLDKEIGILQIRKDSLSFELKTTECELVFESNPDEVVFIKSMMMEVFVLLHQHMQDLQELADPAQFRQELLKGDKVTFAEENKRQIRSMIQKGIAKDCIITELKANTKEGVINELIDRLAAKDLLLDRELCIHDVLQREKIVSTCLQNGVALPHGRTDGVDHLVAAVGIQKKGYTFDALDGKPTKIFVLCLSPKASDGPHIEFIASVGTVLAKQENVEKILAAETPEQIFEILDKKA